RAVPIDRIAGRPLHAESLGRQPHHPGTGRRSQIRIDASRRLPRKPLSSQGKSQAASFRAKLSVAMMLVVAGLTATGLYLAQRNAMADLERGLQRDFQSDLTALHSVEELRYAALAERCRSLVAKPRIHAALEDNALDLL